MQAWQHGLQQGIKGAQASQQKGSGQLDGASGLAHTAQGHLVTEQLQRLGLFVDGDGNLNSGQLQGLVTMLSKQGQNMMRLICNVLLTMCASGIRCVHSCTGVSRRWIQYSFGFDFTVAFASTELRSSGCSDRKTILG